MHKAFLYLTFARKRTIFGSTSYNPPSRFLKEIPEDLLDGYEDAFAKKDDEDQFEDSKYSWNYGNKSSNYGDKYGSKVVSYKVRSAEGVGLNALASTPKTAASFQFRTAESFLNNYKQKENSNTVDLSQYQVGQKVFHKRFGEGTITKLEQRR